MQQWKKKKKKDLAHMIVQDFGGRWGCSKSCPASVQEITGHNLYASISYRLLGVSSLLDLPA